ncbi:Retrotransposon-derived protein PEG10 [Anabarilius grahami]|uniref:Retrotransposon-derived protein PEG10 n=1 Tax=Anabarilius grahami TaxID=495550 RepID=A0A3N0XUR1_ANAGA|nr:Retrotransposon-derived protein PEG10 [Anabarilius grahami]
MQPHLFPTDYSKVAFIISQLSGRALQWAESIWSQKNPVTQTYSGFVEHFREVFGKPSWDSSIGEKLYNLKQGKLSINEYALQFRTLAARSGWNLECGCTRMQSCLEEHQGQSLHNTFLCWPESVSTPEPAQEPMQVESSRLRQRRLTQNLCLYCGLPGHVLSSCPTRPPRPMVSAIISTLQTQKPLSTTITLTAADVSLPVSALIDSGSVGNFISGALCNQLNIKTKNTPTTYQIQSITGRPVSNRRVSRITKPVHLQVGVLHHKYIQLLVLEGSTTDMILGRPWLQQHNPILSWNTGEVLKWGETCFPECFSNLPVPKSPRSNVLPVCATSVESPFEK